MNEVEIVLSYPYQDHEVGDRITVDAVDAKRLVRGGAAVYATAKDATTAGGDPDQAATKRRKG